MQMFLSLNCRVATGLAIAVFLLASASSVRAHVTLDVPNGGEVIDVGSEVLVEWHVVIEHNTMDWDLWYSTTGENGPWLEIVADLPAGDTSAGSSHSYTWTVPDDPSITVRVRVRMDNVGTDYLDISDNDLTIQTQGAIFADGFETGDIGAWSDSSP